MFCEPMQGALSAFCFVCGRYCINVFYSLQNINNFDRIIIE